MKELKLKNRFSVNPSFSTLAVLFLVLGSAALSLFSQQPASAPRWDGWQFLLGEWVGEGTGGPGQGAGGFSFACDLQKRIVVRKSHTEFPTTQERPAFSHDDLMIVYQDAGPVTRAVYFDNEGHVIHYQVECARDQSAVVFLSERLAGAPRFRLTYTKVAPASVRIRFEIAAPGKADDFSPYLEGLAHKK